MSGVALVGSRSLVGPKNSRIEAVVEYHLSSSPPTPTTTALRSIAVAATTAAAAAVTAATATATSAAVTAAAAVAVAVALLLLLLLLLLMLGAASVRRRDDTITHTIAQHASEEVHAHASERAIKRTHRGWRKRKCRLRLYDISAAYAHARTYARGNVRRHARGYG